MSGWVHRFHTYPTPGKWQAVDVLAWVDKVTAIVVAAEPGALGLGQPIAVHIADLHRNEPEPVAA